MLAPAHPQCLINPSFAVLKIMLKQFGTCKVSYLLLLLSPVCLCKRYGNANNPLSAWTYTARPSPTGCKQKATLPAYNTLS